jgi:hypothetical protein
VDEKRCGTCGESRPLDAFAVSRRAGDGRQARCRACWRDWYVDNRDQHLTAVALRRAQVRAAHQQRLAEHLRTHPCVDCGESDLRVLDFDHEEPCDKTADVARLAAMNIAWERIAAEIAKCSVRCANCHRRRTAEMFGYWRHDAEAERQAGLAAAASARLARLTAAGGTMERPPHP